MPDDMPADQAARYAVMVAESQRLRAENAALRAQAAGLRIALGLHPDPPQEARRGSDADETA